MKGKIKGEVWKVGSKSERWGINSQKPKTKNQKQNKNINKNENESKTKNQKPKTKNQNQEWKKKLVFKFNLGESCEVHLTFVPPKAMKLGAYIIVAPSIVGVKTMNVELKGDAVDFKLAIDDGRSISE